MQSQRLKSLACIGYLTKQIINAEGLKQLRDTKSSHREEDSSEDNFLVAENVFQQVPEEPPKSFPTF